MERYNNIMISFFLLLDFSLFFTVSICATRIRIRFQKTKDTREMKDETKYILMTVRINVHNEKVNQELT